LRSIVSGADPAPVSAEQMKPMKIHDLARLDVTRCSTCGREYLEGQSPRIVETCGSLSPRVSYRGRRNRDR
jgi:hypothetical protein